MTTLAGYFAFELVLVELKDENGESVAGFDDGFELVLVELKVNFEQAIANVGPPLNWSFWN